MTKEEKFNTFKLKAERKYNGYYSYDKVDYVDCYTKVCIICPEHGEFWMTPSYHLSVKGCPKCNSKGHNTIKLTNEEFISRARKVHGDNYDYSKVNYINAETPIEIICKEHGVFKQLPNGHLVGQGCPKCAGRQLSTNEVIDKMKDAHPNDDYDYSNVEYTKMHNKVCIVCHKKDKNGVEHGEFWQTPAKHVQGRGCPKCANERRNLWKKVTLEKFKERANKIFNSFYDYSKVEFDNLHCKIKIICPVHGEFEQNIYDHLNGHGCAKCAIDATKSNTDEFIEKATRIHGNKYDYSKVDYKGIRNDVTIICPIHGEFEQTPESHLKGY